MSFVQWPLFSGPCLNGCRRGSAPRVRRFRNSRAPNLRYFRGQSPSEISRIFRRLVEMVVPAIDILDRASQLVGVGIVKRRDRDRVEDATHGLLLPLREGADAAGRAESVVQIRDGFSGWRPLIVIQSVGARDHAKLIGLHD